MAELKLALSVFSVVGVVLTAVKLYRSGLFRVYPIFFAYFIFRVPHSVPPLILDTKSTAYAYYWVATEPVLLVFYILLVVELSRKVLSQYKGLYTVFRAGMIIAMVIAMIISAASLIPRLRPEMPQRSRILGYVYAGERAIDLTLALFILLILVLISRYPIHLSRNLRLHAFVYTVYFFSNTLGFVLRVAFGMRISDVPNVLLMTVTLGAMGAWLLWLNPKGEDRPAPVRSLTEQQEHRLLAQLGSLNTTLLRVSRR